MPASSAPDLTAFDPHDHGSCRTEALATAETLCAARGLRMTRARAFVLETLLESHGAMTAYQVLDRMREAGLGGQPPVAYRALDFLVANGFAHRIERLGAYVACTRSGSDHPAAFLICRSCRRVAETAIDGPPPAIAAADAAGFEVERIVVEAEGLCRLCREAAA
jgi:Fur family zinc uptake transcriptional regulator